MTQKQRQLINYASDVLQVLFLPLSNCERLVSLNSQKPLSAVALRWAQHKPQECQQSSAELCHHEIWRNGQFRICHVLQASGTDFYLMCYFIFASTVLHLPVTEFCERYTRDTAQDPSFTNPNIVVLLANFVSSLLFPNLLRIKSNMD